MLPMVKRLWTEQDGVLAFEWTLLLTLLVIGIVIGVAAARDAIIDELGDTAQVMLAVDQSYHIGFPLQSSVHAVNSSSASNSDFTDALIYTDCDRGTFIGQDGSDDFNPDGA
jgi:Flp pilus assembly pilin Flp